MSAQIDKTIETSPQLVIRQIKEWAEILINFEAKNKYEIQTLSGEKLGYILERDGGLLATLKRLFLRSHRPLEIDILDKDGNNVYHLSRKFFFFFSDLTIADKEGHKLGSIHRRFGIIYKKYDICDKSGNPFAHIQAPIWRLWTFPITNRTGQNLGVITKKWQGLLREAFTDADNFVIDYGKGSWQTPQKTVILCAAISIDFDFFEDNQGNN
ncbi:MAG: hypothetical protein HW386_252 [Gammaproteobacteria bacterium]|nr:hypothetical protein [Gammaproteobacteria bacterium]